MPAAAAVRKRESGLRRPLSLLIKPSVSYGVISITPAMPPG